MKSPSRLSPASRIMLVAKSHCFVACPLYIHVCTWQGYYVSSKQGTNTHRVMPSHLKPTILQPLVVQGQFQMTSGSQVSSDSLLILHFILENLEAIGSLHACYMNASRPSLHTMMWPL